MTATSRTWPAWSTTVHVAVSDPGALDTACLVVRDEMARTARAADRFDRTSELSVVNAAEGRPVAVSPDFVRLLRMALDAAEATGGLVDPTLGAQLHAAGYDRDIAEYADSPAAPSHRGPPPAAGSRSPSPRRPSSCPPASCSTSARPPRR